MMRNEELPKPLTAVSSHNSSKTWEGRSGRTERVDAISPTPWAVHIFIRGQGERCRDVRLTIPAEALLALARLFPDPQHQAELTKLRIQLEFAEAQITALRQRAAEARALLAPPVPETETDYDLEVA